MEPTISITVRELLLYHTFERLVLDRLRSHCPLNIAKNIVVLWVWLERIGFHDFVATATRSNDFTLVQYAREAEAILDVLRQDAPPPSDNPYAIPRTASIVSRPVGLRFFYANRDAFIQGMAEIMDGIGTVIFDDRLRDLMRRDEYAPELTRPFVRAPATTPEHMRTMFLMFTRNQPLSTGQLVHHFTTRWGDCVERVLVEPTRNGISPMYGRVVFRTAAYLDLVLNGSQQTEFVIAGRQFWGMRPIRNGYDRPRP